MTELEKTRIRMEMEEELKEYRKLSKVHRNGRRWLKEMRQALGMSVTEIAHRLGCARSLVYRIEEAEGRGADRIDTLQEVARAMGCELIYAIVPRRGETLEKTAEHLRNYPQWETPKQQERRRKASDEYTRKRCAEHWAWVREKKEQEEDTRRVQRLGLQLARELPGEERRRAEEAAKTGKPMEVGWVAKWVYERWEALDKQMEEEKAARGARKKVEVKPGEEPAAWKAARTAKQMAKLKIPGDWALRMATEATREQGGKAGAKPRDANGSGAGANDGSDREGDLYEAVIEGLREVTDQKVLFSGIANGRRVGFTVRVASGERARQVAGVVQRARGKRLKEIRELILGDRVWNGV